MQYTADTILSSYVFFVPLLFYKHRMLSRLFLHTASNDNRQFRFAEEELFPFDISYYIIFLQRF